MIYKEDADMNVVQNKLNWHIVHAGLNVIFKALYNKELKIETSVKFFMIRCLQYYAKDTDNLIRE